MMLSPVNPSEILARLVEAFKASKILVKGARVEISPGTLTESWVNKTSLPHGGAFFACTGIGRIEHHGDATPAYVLSFGAYFFAAAGKSRVQASGALDQVHQIMRWLDFNHFDIVGAERPVDIRCRNAFSPTLDAKGAALWMLDWRQTFLFSKGSDFEPSKVEDALYGRTVIARNFQ